MSTSTRCVPCGTTPSWYHGRFVDFAGVDAYPRPVQRRLPLVIGGHTPAAYRRAIARGDGWYGYGLTPERAAECAAGLKAAADRVQRPEALGGLEISVTPRGQVTRELAERFAKAGVHRLVVLVQPGDGGPERAIVSGAAAVAGLYPGPLPAAEGLSAGQAVIAMCGHGRLVLAVSGAAATSSVSSWPLPIPWVRWRQDRQHVPVACWARKTG